MSCSVSNKYGCIALKDKLCGWDTENLVCQTVSIVTDNTCSYYLDTPEI